MVLAVYVCVRMCAGGDAVESVNQSSTPTERLRQQLTSESSMLGLLSPCRKDPNIHKPNYSATQPLNKEHSLTQDNPFFLSKSIVNQPIQAWRFAHHGLINQSSSSPNHCGSKPSGAENASCEENTMSKKRSALLGKCTPPP